MRSRTECVCVCVLRITYMDPASRAHMFAADRQQLLLVQLPRGHDGDRRAQYGYGRRPIAPASFSVAHSHTHTHMYFTHIAGLRPQVNGVMGLASVPYNIWSAGVARSLQCIFMQLMLGSAAAHQRAAAQHKIDDDDCGKRGEMICVTI